MEGTESRQMRAEEQSVEKGFYRRIVDPRSPFADLGNIEELSLGSDHRAGKRSIWSEHISVPIDRRPAMQMQLQFPEPSACEFGPA